MRRRPPGHRSVPGGTPGVGPRRHDQGRDDSDADAFGSPLVRGHTAEATDGFLRRGIGSLVVLPTHGRAAEDPQCFGHSGCGNLRLGDIAPDEMNLVAQLRGQAVSSFFVDINGHDGTAFGDQASRNAQADARCPMPDAPPVTLNASLSRLVSASQLGCSAL